MRRRTLLIVGLTWVLVLGLSATRSAGGEKARVILNRGTPLRTWMVYRTPVVIGTDGKIKAAATPRRKRGKVQWHEIGKFQSPLPTDVWRETGFPDWKWQIGSAPVEKPQGHARGGSPAALHSSTDSAMICARAKFLVKDPARAGDLRLSVTYVGGVAVYLNGKEITRAHLPKGKLGPETLADKYPDDLYITADGKFMQHYKNRDAKRFARRYRRLRKVVVPASGLRKGLNVLAFQVHRAAVNEPATKVQRRVHGGMRDVYGLWSYAALTDLELTAPSGAGIIPNVGRRLPGVQVWNCQSFETLSANSYGDPGGEPGPVEIDAVRNGAFSGRFVVSANRDIKGLKVEVSELAISDGKARIPREAVVLRHARLGRAADTPRPGNLFDGLMPGVPQQVKYIKKRVHLGWRWDVNVEGAVLPVWITVRPPKDAAPGLYEGKVTVTAQGLKQTVVPLRVRVHGWTLPDPVDWRVKTLNVFSPYSVAAHYRVPLWSEKHFKMLEKSFRLMAAAGARRVDIDMVPVIRARDARLGDSMFRLVPKKGGTGYEYDFSVIEKVFDLVKKTMKRPQPLVVNCWGNDDWWKDQKDKKKGKKFDWGRSAIGVPVLDPATGKLTSIRNPKPGTEECYKFWKPILDDLRKRIEKRGWFAVTAIGHQSYCYPPKPPQVDIALRIWPDGKYSYTAHDGKLNSSFKGSKGSMPVLSSECVWTQGHVKHRGYKSLLAPGRDKSIWNSCGRDAHPDNCDLILLLRKSEEMIMRGHDGLGFLLVDFLPLENPKRKGRYYYLDANVGGVRGHKSTRSLLAAGPDGPVATGRYEMFREGVQQCEAILYLQRALNGGKLPKALADKVNGYLDRRSRAFVKCDWPIDRQDLDRRLFEMAAKAAAASGR